MATGALIIWMHMREKTSLKRRHPAENVVLLCLIAAALLLFFSACTGSDRPDIVGVWKGGHDDGSLIFTFREDGTFTQAYSDVGDLPPKSIDGRWFERGGDYFAKPFLLVDRTVEEGQSAVAYTYRETDEKRLQIDWTVNGGWELTDAAVGDLFRVKKVN